MIKSKHTIKKEETLLSITKFDFENVGQRHVALVKAMEVNCLFCAVASRSFFSRIGCGQQIWYVAYFALSRILKELNITINSDRIKSLFSIKIL